VSDIFGRINKPLTEIIWKYKVLYRIFVKIKIMKISKIQLNSESPYKRSGEPKKNFDKIYIWIENETIWENMNNRRNRPHTTYKKEILPKLMEHLEMNFPKVYEHLKNVKWGWSQSCGCSMCPCSPGFIGNEKRFDEVLDIHITIK